MGHHRDIRELAAAEDGALIVFVAFTFAILIGLIALSFDLGRVGVTQTDMQAYADNIALAAAGELDGGTDAITRAHAAAANMIADEKRFGDGDDTLFGATDYTLAFLTDLPADDNDPLTAFTTDPEEAAYVLATTMQTTVGLTFAAAMKSLLGQASTDPVVSASAVGGFTSYACDVTPLMFCLPTGGYSADANIGDMLLLRSGGQGAAWGPGDFGFVDPSSLAIDQAGPCAGLTGANQFTCLLAVQNSITQCVPQRGINTEPGQKTGLADVAFNVRFDIYRTSLQSEKNNPDYAPAPNVIKGVVPNGGGFCIAGNEQPSPDTVGLPRDACFALGTCAHGNRVGDGDWAAGRVNYEAVNYPPDALGNPTAPVVDADATRYEYYLAEIAAAGGASSSTRILPAGLSETGRPQCSNQQSSNPKRRIVFAAGVDCVENPVSGATNNVPVEEFFELFLTEPVGTDGNSPPTLDIWAEVVGSASQGGGTGGGVFHDIVQLYR